MCERESDKSFVILTVRREIPTEKEAVIDDAKPKNLRLVSEDIYKKEQPSPAQAGSRWGQIQLSTV